jgi:hypothetical protein
MPWHIANGGGSCPASKPWAVIKDSDGSTAGCHPTKAAAAKQLAALYANEDSMSSTMYVGEKGPERFVSTAAPVDNLVRALFGPESAELRAQADTEGDGGTLFGHFAVFDTWTEINSAWEGNFLERIAPGAFAETIRARGDQIKVLYDHGQDPQLGNKPLGSIDVLREDTKGAYYEVSLLRGADGTLVPYNRDFIMPAAKAGLLGASFRFKVTGESWVDPEKSTAKNPARLSERTIEALDLYEFGPVTFPAYEAATAAVRCGTDRFLDSVVSDPRFAARLIERVGIKTVEQIIAGIPAQSVERAADGSPDTTQATSAAADGPQTWSPDEHRIMRHKQSTVEFDAHLARLHQETR